MLLIHSLIWQISWRALILFADAACTAYSPDPVLGAANPVPTAKTGTNHRE